MLAFFRKIRKALLGSGQTRKYVLYAIGEIALVVIGILIALQINNWNDNRINIEKERVYLERLHTDLSADSTSLSSRKHLSHRENEGYRSFLRRAYITQNSLEEFSELWGLLWVSSLQLTIQNSTYLELVSTGQLDIITNDKLKVSLLNLYKQYEEVGNHMSEFNEYSASILTELARRNASLKFYPPNLTLFEDNQLDGNREWEWINDPSTPEFKIAVEVAVTYYRKHEIFIGYFDELLLEVGNILGMIQEEIGKPRSL